MEQFVRHVILQGLQFLRDSYPSSKERDVLLAQIKLCNDIVKKVALHTEELDFLDNEILDKGEAIPPANPTKEVN